MFGLSCSSKFSFCTEEKVSSILSYSVFVVYEAFYI